MRKLLPAFAHPVRAELVEAWSYGGGQDEYE
jgi:hypothetical protein